MTSIDVSVSGTVNAFWVWVDAQPLKIDGGGCTIELENGRHALTWVMGGNPGETLSITLSRGVRTVVPRRARMPVGKPLAFGGLYFDV